LPVLDAYRVGAQRVHDLATWCEAAGIGFVSVWALSRDNLQRGSAAVAEITDVVVEALVAMAAIQRWRIRVIGTLDLLPIHTVTALHAVVEGTRAIDGVTLNVAIAYDGRADIVTAVRELILEFEPDAEGLPVLTERQLAQHLSTAGQPDIDMVIRTGGEYRLSGFMPWQAANAELYFTPDTWPDFTHCDFEHALLWYAQRDRRFGR
jgi:short-chain Z-isoprenyl diphosphate synthase